MSTKEGNVISEFVIIILFCLPRKSWCVGSEHFLLICSLFRTEKSTCTNVHLPVSFIICSGQLKDFMFLCSVFNVLFFCLVDSVQEQQDQSYAASIQYQPGDQCFVSKTKSDKLLLVLSMWFPTICHLCKQQFPYFQFNPKNMNMIYFRQKKNLVNTEGFSDDSILSWSTCTINYKIVCCSFIAVSALCLPEKINAYLFVYIYFCHAIIQDVFLENFTPSLCHRTLGMPDTYM